ncbi:unnamed protein product (macronuclear) [Paramecium tetraurelia]|uniref:Chromo domain-containing protein n=1 Tax=Paramecium tetraurelia TaxID=5888 RepID=A0CN34_PARTE|nr:uncharacterized protein GSPATT00008642001 [Paramecium tetraurelia]CAK72201.1 unnamed protein product [Paramecium tetraurelia]|eukprot:XP_001439598.1 hypothetical protein (macronuclear) [Paramecium tetraurelia strain d4-2]
MKSTGEKYQKQLNQRSPEKILSKRNNNGQLQYLIKWKNHEEPTWEFEEYIRNQIQNLLTSELEQKTHQNEKQVEPLKNLQRTVQQSFKHPNCSEELLFNKQREMTQKYCNAYPQSGDEIDSVQLILTQEDCIFEIKWKSRSDGLQPISDFYQYDQFKVVAPMLFMDFLEICILGFEKNSDIQFIAPGKDNIERSQLIKRILLQNSKYVDTNKNQLEEVKVDEQTTQVKKKNVTSKKNTKITFMQSDQKQKQLIQPQSSTELQQQNQEQQQNENQSQQNNNQRDEKLLEDKQPEQQQVEQKEQNVVDQNQNQNYEEQIEQESISLEQQQEE